MHLDQCLKKKIIAFCDKVYAGGFNESLESRCMMILY